MKKRRYERVCSVYIPSGTPQNWCPYSSLPFLDDTQCRTTRSVTVLIEYFVVVPFCPKSDDRTVKIPPTRNALIYFIGLVKKKTEEIGAWTGTKVT